MQYRSVAVINNFIQSNRQRANFRDFIYSARFTSGQKWRLLTVCCSREDFLLLNDIEDTRYVFLGKQE